MGFGAWPATTGGPGLVPPAPLSRSFLTGEKILPYNGGKNSHTSNLPPAEPDVEDLASRVKHVLAVYLERGRLALAALAEGRIDDARETLALRNAAFHNLRAVDALAQGAGQDAAMDPQTLALWDETRRVDAALVKALADAHAETKQLYERVREARRKIGKYRARKGERTSFTKSA